MRYLVLACLLLSACGQAGDLYLPADPAAQPVPRQAAPAEEPKKKDAR